MKIIVAVDMNWGIGYEDSLLITIPKDLKNFKELTTNNTIVYGRKTLSSFKKAKTLPNRRNIILTRNKDLLVDNAELIYDVDQALKRIKELEDNGENVFIIGGEEIYKQFIDYCDEIYVTKIFDEFFANKHFPNIDRMQNWEIEDVLLEDTYITEKEKEIDFSIIKYKNNAPKEY